MMHLNPAHKGMFHEDVGKSVDAPISLRDVAKGLKAKSPAERTRANFARMAKRHFKPLPK